MGQSVAGEMRITLPIGTCNTENSSSAASDELREMPMRTREYHSTLRPGKSIRRSTAQAFVRGVSKSLVDSSAVNFHRALQPDLFKFAIAKSTIKGFVYQRRQ